MKEGKLIVVEGAGDGIGKTTQYESLCKHLKQDGINITGYHFPSYGTYQAVPVEKYLSGEYGNIANLSPYFINNLYATDRGITWHTILKPLYEDGQVIVLDRYTTSSLIYQSALISDITQKQKFLDYVIDFEYSKLGIKEPDDIVFLHTPFSLLVELMSNRRQNEGIVNDIHERDLAFMKKVYDSAMFVADYFDWNKVQCNDGNKMRPISDIHEEVYSLIKKRK